MRERQPHIYGATPLHYRQGVAVANGESPPTWSPEMANDQQYPYTLEEFRRDVSRWQAATKVTVARQGPLLALAIGGSARSLIDDIDEILLMNGGVSDFNDGLGYVQRSGID